ncbi:MAG: RodZ domain-containing protein [Candidatus Zixiibacteriota bacterium]
MKNGRTAGSRNGATSEPSAVHPVGTRIDIAPPEIDIAKDRLGATLSARRLALGLRVEDIAEDIKVRQEYIRALEQEELHRLPTPQHARLFVKAYAERLGLNVAEVYALHDLCESPVKVKAAAETAPSPPKEPKEPTGGRVTPTWIWVAGSIVIVVAVLSAWFFSRGHGDTEPAPEGRGAAPVHSDTVTAPVTEPTVPARPVVPPLRLVLDLSRDTWVRVVADGDTIESRIARVGEHIEASAQVRLELSLGHAVGVAAAVNGAAVTPVVARATAPGGLVITPDSLVAWFGPNGAVGRSDTVLVPAEQETTGSGGP